MGDSDGCAGRPPIEHNVGRFNRRDAVNNADVVAALTEIAELLELKGEGSFRIRAYENAAKILGGLTEDVRSLAAHGDLTKVKGSERGLPPRSTNCSALGILSTSTRCVRSSPMAYDP
jgi:DNA polymerase (family 10)